MEPIAIHAPAMGKERLMILSAGIPRLIILSDASKILSKSPGISQNASIPKIIIPIASFNEKLRASLILSLFLAP